MQAGVELAQATSDDRYTHDVHSVIQALLAGDTTEWPVLVAHVHDVALAVCERRQAHRGHDFARNVALRVIERLRRDEYQALRRFAELRLSYPTLGFEKWTRAIINNALVDELRSLPGVGRTRTEMGRELTRREHVLFEDEQHLAAPAMGQSSVFDARRILRWIHDENFPSLQRSALLMWLSGHSVADCARLLKLDESETQRILRAARQRLRRQFQEPS